jgi:uncharacterized protein YndB with AHSA1/START domain
VTGRAKLATVDDRPVLRLERRLAHGPEKVWRAITDPAELAHWFPATVEAELRPGGAIRFTFPGETESTTGEVLIADPPRELAYTWNSDTLHWRITPDGTGSKLEFTHTFGRGDPAIARLAAGRNAAGWDVCLDALTARLAGESFAQPSQWHDRMASYIEEFGLDDGEIVGERTIRFRRDLVWKPLDEVWPLLEADGEVTTSEPPNILESVGVQGKVRWELTRDPLEGVRVELIQTVPEGVDLPTVLARRHEQLDALFAKTHGMDIEPWSADRVDAVRKHYRQTQG